MLTLEVLRQKRSTTIYKHQKVDVMISPITTSFLCIIAGRRWFPFHRPAERRTLSQDRLVFESSKVIPEKQSHQKPEYTNTHQD